MKLSEIQELWTKDCIIDETNLGHSSSITPKLQAKYLNLLTTIKLQLRKSESEYLKLRRIKYRYYRGELSKEELKALNWDQWQGLKPLKNEMDEFLTTDNDLIDLEDKTAYIKTIHYQLENILKSINSRTWDIKNAIEYQKMISGG